MLGACAPQHAGLRLSTVARDSISLDGALRVMRTVIEPVDPGAAMLEHVRDVAMRVANEWLVEEPAGDPCLIGRDNHGEPGAIQQPDRVDAVWKEAYLIQPVEIADFLDERSVAIENDRPPHAVASS